MSLREIPDSELEYNEDFERYLFEAYRAEWEREQKEDPWMPSNFGIVPARCHRADASQVYLYRYVTLKETRDHLISRGRLKQ